jgi:hypothetical protein
MNESLVLSKQKPCPECEQGFQIIEAAKKPHGLD